MTRAYGLTGAIRDAFAPTETLFVFVTMLGETGGLLGLAVLTFWLGPHLPGWDRRRGLVLVGVALCAITVVGVPKAFFDLARPATGAATAPGWLPAGLDRLYIAAAESDSPGFPSGHATSAAAVYGTLALTVAVGRRRTRLATASLVIALVALSRVVIGVHYVVDIVVGSVLGATLVVLAVRVGRDRPGLLFALATLTGALWVLISGGGGDALVAFGFAGGATAVWQAGGRSLAPAELDSSTTLLVAVAGAVTVGPTLVLARVLSPGLVPVALAVVGGALALGLPGLAAKKEARTA